MAYRTRKFTLVKNISSYILYKDRPWVGLYNEWSTMMMNLNRAGYNFWLNKNGCLNALTKLHLH